MNPFKSARLVVALPVLLAMTPHHATQPRTYTAQDWAAAIDATWGPSDLTATRRMMLFQGFWDRIDEYFACFQDLDVDWDALYAKYAAEVGGPISKGRFSAIMNHLSRALKESHTFITDLDVTQTNPAPGVPILQVGAWGDNGRFGAGLTPLSDKSLLVYQARANHPLGLQAGDIVLGYDGRPWADLVQELVQAELPLLGVWGSSPSSYEHALLMSAGMNWHLFDTIDVVKHDTGEHQHLPTSSLVGQYQEHPATEQLPVPGVTKPDLAVGETVTWGVVTGTQIGYIYVSGWYGTAGTDFYDALHALIVEQETTGLIVDFRTNYGGNMFLSDAGFDLLYDTTFQTIGFGVRCDPDDHLAMCNGSPDGYNIHGDPGTSYDRPIAVLAGPGAGSSGDQTVLRFAFHPEARFFGRSTATAFNVPEPYSTGYSNWWGRYASLDAYLVSNPTNYLTHDELPIDCAVWLAPDDVVEGRDSVVQAALDWIQGVQPDPDGDGIGHPCDNCATVHNPAQLNVDGDPAGDSCDCAANEPYTYPGAAEVNDGLDNQCFGQTGFGVVDETSGDSGFHSSTQDEYSWTPQIGTTLYQVARASQPDFSSNCIVTTTATHYWIDAGIPPQGEVFYYLNRPLLPHTGSWGVSSAGAERTVPCS